MSQVQNLLDMFLNNRKDVQAKGAKAPESKSQTGKGAQNLMPMESADKGIIGGAAPKSFQAKVAESRAKLAKANTPAPQDKAPEAKPARPAQTDKSADRADAARQTRNDRTERARSDRADRNDRADQADRTDRPGADQADRADTGGKQASDRSDDADRSAGMGRGRMQSRAAGARADDTDDNAQPQAVADGSQPVQDAQPAAAADAPADTEAALKQLKDGLETLGIKADDAQLQDPSFLSDLLQMLQALPAQAVTAAQPDAGAQPAAAADLAAATVTDATQTADAPVAAQILPDAAPAISAQPQDAGADALPADDAQSAPVEAKPADRKELAALIRDRIDALTKPVMGGQDAAPIANANANTNANSGAPAAPAGWQGLKLRPQAESAPTQPLPMADLDRMRVLQAAALQAGNAGKEIASAPAPKASQGGEAVGPVQETGNAVSFSDRIDDAGEHGNAAASDQDADMFGQNGNASHGTETAAPKEGAPVSKDGGAIPQFQNNLEQARALEHRAGAERAWAPRPAFEPSALEQIAKKLSAIGHKNGEEINIQLSPEHLGKVRVSLEMKDGAMNARIGVENEDVRQQMEASIATLRDALENQGIKLQGLEVSVDQRHGSLFNPDGSNAESFFQRNHKGGQGAQQGAAEVAPFESAPESDTGRRWGYNTMEYIG